MDIVDLVKNLIYTKEHYTWLLSNLVFCFIFAYLDCATFTKIFNIETKKINFWLAVLFSGINRLIFIIISPVHCFRALNIINSIIMFKLFFKVGTEKCILGEVINAIIIITCEAAFAKLCCVIFENVSSYMNGIYEIKYNFCLMSSILVIRTIVYLVMKKQNMFIQLNDNLEKKNKYRIMSISIIGCVIIYFNAIEMTMYISDFPYSIFVLDIVSLILYFYISINSVIRISVLENKEKEIQNLEVYNKTLSIMYDSIRSFKHDFFNFVQALNGYVKIRDIEGIKLMNDAVLKDCEEVNQLSIFDPKIFNNPAVYSVVTNKYHLAHKNNVDFNVEILRQPSGFEKYNYEFCRILCILLDNAIEAAMECEEKKVNLKFMKVEDKIVTIVENTYKDFDYDIEKIFEKGFTTKHKDKKEHGLGLWNVKMILRHNKVFNLETTKSDLFRQCLGLSL